MMNVDEAMEEARQFGEKKPKNMLFGEHIAILLATEIERLRAELAQFRKDWCDDDEAIKQQALRVLDAAKVEGDSVYVPRMGALAEMIADEMERLRVWNKRWRDISNRLRREVGNLEVMLQRRLQEIAGLDSEQIKERGE